jgi:hypothetical protein
VSLSPAGARLASIGLAIAAAIAIAAVVGLVPRPAPNPIRSADPVVDLLGWLPVTEQTRRAFAVWTDEADQAGAPPTAPAIGADQAGQVLDIEPLPLTLGLSRDWPARFGWRADEVTAWAVGGRGAEQIAILDGRFDESAVRRRLTEAGYRESSYLGARLLETTPSATPGPIVGGDAVAAATAVALLDGRLITAPSAGLVRQAIEAATGGRPSLASDAQVSSLLRTLDPLSGLMVIDAADQAVACAVGRPPGNEVMPRGQPLAVAFGHLGDGGARRTLLAITLPDDAKAAPIAAAAAEEFANGWLDGRVAGGALVSPLANFARLSNVSQSGPLVVAEFVEGRAGGWAPAAIRFAGPVCAATTDLASPTGSSPPQAASAFDAALLALPEATPDRTLLVADLRRAAAAPRIAAPVGLPPDPAAVAAWVEAIRPLPPFSVFPTDSDRLATFSSTVGIPLGAIDLVAEVRGPLPEETVGMLVGTWREVDLVAALRAAGYDEARLAREHHFAMSSEALSNPDHPVQRTVGSTWNYLIVLDNRLFMSSSRPVLREAVDRAIAAERVAGASPSSWSRLLETAPGAVAAVITGAASIEPSCPPHVDSLVGKPWSTIGAVWSIDDGAGNGLIVASSAAGATEEQLVATLDRQIKEASVPADLAAPANTIPLTSLGYDGITTRRLAIGGPVVVAHFAPPPRAPVAGFLAASVGNCGSQTVPTPDDRGLEQAG